MLAHVIEPRRRDLGGGFEVGRLLPYAKQHMVGSFIFFDQFGPAHFAAGIPRTVDVRPHPHIGLSTVSYLFEGEIMHRDSVGSEQAVRPGEVNWMIAGKGITHSERFEKARAEGGPLHGIQAWVALPERDEETDPGFFHYGAGALPEARDGGVWTRIIAGEGFGMKAAVKTHSPMIYAHHVLDAGAALHVPAMYAERAIYVVSGAVEVDNGSYETGRMLVFTPGSDVVVRAPLGAVVLTIGGEPLGHRYIEWNFVSSSKERIEQAKADWRAGRMKLPDLDDGEFIPLPPDPPPPANPIS